MAALTTTEVFGAGEVRLPIGQFALRTLRFTIANANAADEWIATGLSDVLAVVGIVAIGQADVAEIPAVRKNAQGTGQAEDSSLGDLAVEGNAATWEVTFIGKV